MTAIEEEPVPVRDAARRNAGISALLPPAVHWREGMLLMPQHFQSTAVRSETLPYYHAATVSPFHWGLLDFEPGPPEALTIKRVEAVMPDGLIVRYPDAATTYGGASDLTFDLASALEKVKDGKANTVYLAVAARETFGERYDFRNAHDSEEETDDELNDVLRPRLQLVLSGETLSSSYSGFPIAKLHIANGKVERTDGFGAPWLRVAPRSAIHTICESVASLLRHAAEDLHKRIAGHSASTHGAQLLETRMVIQALVSALPPFELLLDSGAAHPFTLYLALASVVGSVAGGAVPPALDPYDHDNALPCFQSAQKHVMRLVHESVREKYRSVPFPLVRDNIEGEVFRLRFDPAWAETETLLGVRIPRGGTREEVHQWITNSTIASQSRIHDARKDRRLGAIRVLLTEHELIPMAGVVFYELKRPFNEFVVPGEALVISNRGEKEAHRPDEILLYVREAESQER